VQDAQRAISLARARASEFGIDGRRIGILGFSAGGETAGLATLFKERTYESVDAADQVSVRPDFAVLVYAAGLANQENTALRDYVHVDETTPPVFMAHAFDDGVRVENPMLLFLELKKHAVPAELHVYSKGGHGYGLRETEQPVTTWHYRCAEWMKVQGLLESKR
jgi:acetyl esterase/lipase